MVDGAAGISPASGGRGGEVEDAAVDFRRPRLDSAAGEKAEGAAEWLTVSAGLGVAGVDGEVRGTAAGRRRSRERLGIDLDPEKRGAGDGGEREQQGDDLLIHGRQGARRRGAQQWPRRHGAQGSTVATGTRR